MKRSPVYIFFVLATLSDASVGSSRLHIAAMSGASSGLVHAIDALVSAGADVNAKAQNGITPLHEAARFSTWSTGAIEALISSGADVNARERDGYTPLHVAVMFDLSGGFVHVIEALVEAGANVAIKNKAGETPLDLAYEKRSKAAVIAALEAAAR